MNKIIFTLLVFLLQSNGHAQSKIDSILNSLNNKDVIYSLVMVNHTDRPDYVIGKSVYVEVDIKSIDVYSLLKLCSKDTLINKLIPLLMDKERDWYANLLLYQLTEKLPFDIIRVDNRVGWLKPIQEGSKKTYKDKDLKMWRKYNKNT